MRRKYESDCLIFKYGNALGLVDEAADLGWDKNVWEDNGDGHQPQDARLL
ncbi:Putative uncharacterized protein [Halomonas sp. R57-5]|nr:Putative uncharacterized protein [Halomonas sp. R57-5]